ncbi:MAG: hypothetical protein IJZ39_13135 [Oscillospiraceae bacterium]|nr:hypothetical protein [Oscillospiraceae bacterium]
MWMLGLYIVIYFGAPAAAILTAIIWFWRESVRKNREALESGEQDEQALNKLRRRKIALTVAVVIGGVFVAAIITVAILFSTSIAFM